MVFWSALRPWLQDFRCELTILCEEGWRDLLANFWDMECIGYPRGLLQHGQSDSTSNLGEILQGRRVDLALNFLGSSASIDLLDNVETFKLATFCPAKPTLRGGVIICANQWSALAREFPREGQRDAQVLRQMTGWAHPRTHEGPMLEMFHRPSVSVSVFIHPGASRSDKSMGSQWWISVALKLRKHGVRVIWNRGPFEVERSDPYPQGVEVVTPRSVHELVKIMAKCTVFAGNDSGPMHIAANLPIPVFAVFVEADPEEWFPWKCTHASFVNRHASVQDAVERVLSLIRARKFLPA